MGKVIEGMKKAWKLTSFDGRMFEQLLATRRRRSSGAKLEEGAGVKVEEGAGAKSRTWRLVEMGKCCRRKRERVETRLASFDGSLNSCWLQDKEGAGAKLEEGGRGRSRRGGGWVVEVGDVA